ncbi:winged helix DNA-binding domain-containing protein [Paenibacillus sp. MAH-36]|uniref:Winged helix DNA-binding domain-containing protein n=1 Tax=Paenibacillus violae TaxID=3077234 RepID=A0ABU3RKE8_9BACL|nr:winged helix DNA-binding domain-containing protein [Paenibacillus sp. PFR10]MDU0204489.1 winged helix DNA-binding domain-containing protein [Paenibacillus sp. PFR10]
MTEHMDKILSRRDLNRALLARQLLLRRSDMPVLAAVRHLVGLQAQAPNPPYVGLWTRLQSFHHEQLSQLILDRSIVRIALMRSTIHLVTADDCVTLRPILQAVQDRGLQGAFGKKLAELDLDALAAAGRALLEAQPLTLGELGKRLRAQWPQRDATALAQAVRCRLPLVQVPPRGIWGAAGQAAHTTAEAWLSRPLAEAASVDAMLLRYLAAFGPASVKDMQVWSGLTRLREVMERLRPGLLVFRDEHGSELFDLPEAPRPDASTPAPPRFLGEFDNMLLSYDDRSRIMAEELKQRVFTYNGIIRAALLIDGFVSGTWSIVMHKRKVCVLTITLFRVISSSERASVEAEAEGLCAFHFPEAESVEICYN